MNKINNRLTVLIATANAGKMEEIKAIYQAMPIKLISAAEAGIRLHVEEDGQTYAENAAKKANAYCAASGEICLADDSGLEVDQLNGAPGLYSARYAPSPNATDEDRCQFLLKNLAGKPQPWLARFHCTIAIATPAGALFHVDGHCHGEIITEMRGNNGFGYDPIFYMPEYACTMAELDGAIKNQISHRAVALRNALPLLNQLIASNN